MAFKNVLALSPLRGQRRVCYGIYCRLHKLSPATIHVA